MRRAGQADAAGVIAAARVGKGAAADIAERMKHRLNLLPTIGAKIFGVTAVNAPRASAAARRVEPIDEPIQTIRERWSRRELHDAGIYQIKRRGQ
jgi:hypothetical protein